MAKIYYENNTSRPKKHPLKTPHYWILLSVVVLGLGISSKTIGIMWKSTFSELTKLNGPLLNVGNVLITIGLLAFCLVIVILTLKFLWFGNPHNKGKPLERFYQSLLARQIQRGMMDAGIVNPRKKSKGFELSDVYPNLGSDATVRIEVVGNTAKELEKIERLINASLKGRFKNLIVEDYVPDDSGLWFTFTLRDSSVSARLLPKFIVELAPKSSYQLQLMRNVYWDISKSPHALIAGQTGSGKTYAVYGLILQMLLGKGEVCIADPKRGSLSRLKDLFPPGHVSSNKDEILTMLSDAVELMHERQEGINRLSKSHSTFDDDFTQFPEMNPVYIIIDEVGALMASFTDTKEGKLFLSQLKQLVLKARSAGICILLLTQQPNANSIPTDIRDQLGLRILLGKSSLQNRQMVFGEGWEYVQTSFPRGTGLFMLEGINHNPTRIETIDLSQLNEDLYQLFAQVTKGTVS